MRCLRQFSWGRRRPAAVVGIRGGSIGAAAGLLVRAEPSGLADASPCVRRGGGRRRPADGRGGERGSQTGLISEPKDIFRNFELILLLLTIKDFISVISE